MNKEIMKKAIELRHELHRHPELSMQERHTKAYLMRFLAENTGFEPVDCGNWFYAVYRAGEGRKNIAFRADFDAVPVNEPAQFVPYASENPGVAHKCGHDGHSACLMALAMELSKHGADCNVFFVFQHAEETGQGAIECVDFIKNNNIQEVYAFHNLPGVPQKAVFAPYGVAQCCSKGVKIAFKGKRSHACYPENGINPAYAIADIVKAVPSLISPDKYKGMVLATIIYIDVGEHAFGTSAGEGEIALTIRGEFEEEMNLLQTELESLSMAKAEEYGLQINIDYEDEFPETRNSDTAVDKVRGCAKKLGIPLVEAERLRASEDFGYFTKVTEGAMFYVGSGECAAPLHTIEYDFPDDIMETAVDMFMQLITESK